MSLTPSLPISEANSAVLLQTLTAEKTRRSTENRLAYYKPYAKQREFHSAGAKHRERLLIAANQVGKTWAGANESAMYATGRYTKDWEGCVFHKPTTAWVGSPTATTLRDNPQRVLLGRIGEHGTGTIPKDAIVELIAARNIADLADRIRSKIQSW